MCCGRQGLTNRHGTPLRQSRHERLADAARGCPGAGRDDENRPALDRRRPAACHARRITRPRGTQPTVSDPALDGSRRHSQLLGDLARRQPGVHVSIVAEACCGGWSVLAAPQHVAWAFLPAWQLTAKLGPQDGPTCRGFASQAIPGQVGAEMKVNLVSSCRPGNDPGGGNTGRLDGGIFAGVATNGEVGGSGRPNLSRFCPPGNTRPSWGRNEGQLGQ